MYLPRLRIISYASMNTRSPKLLSFRQGQCPPPLRVRHLLPGGGEQGANLCAPERNHPSGIFRARLVSRCQMYMPAATITAAPR